MQVDRITFATITWARTPEEDALLRGALRALSGFSRPIVVADGGSDPAFLAAIRELPHVTVVTPERPGVVGQTRASLKAALGMGTDFIVYTESDKRHFFEHRLRAFIEAMPEDDGLGVGIASRDAASFATFPATQQITESTINGLFAREIGVGADFCYGPLVINRALVPALEGLDPALGWGWRFFLTGVAVRKGYRLQVFEADLPCPPDQREDEPSERIHRMRQLGQNLQGVVLAMQAPLEPGA
jgi:hypothetical protein